MKGKNINLLLGKLCASICEGVDLSSGGTYTCVTNVIRVAAKEDSYVKSSVFDTDTVHGSILYCLCCCFGCNRTFAF